MKKLLIILAAVALSATIWAQSPEKMSYQAVIRNSSSELVTSTAIGMQISILQGSAEGPAVYVERHFPTTNENGLVTLKIGDGTIVSGDFTGIDWSDGPYFLKTETDLNGGANYTISGTSQVLSVPYALHTKTAENFTGTITESQVSDLQAYLTVETDPAIAENFYFTGAVSGDLLQFNGAKWVRVTPDYAAGSHNHSATDITSGTMPIETGGTNSSTIGTAGRVAYSNGSAYAFTSVGTAGQVLVSSGPGAPTWTSSPTVTEINYSSPRTHYSTVGEASFRPRNGDEMVELGYGNGGAYLIGTTAAGGGLYAELDVPVGATVTQIDIGYYDADPNDRLHFVVNGQSIMGTYGYGNIIGSADTNTSAGAGFVSITDLNYPVSSEYRLRLQVLAQTNAGTSIPWPGNLLKVAGVRIHYQISEAF